MLKASTFAYSSLLKVTSFAKKWVLFLLLGSCCLPVVSEAQNAKYLVLLKDKTGTPFTTDKPEAFLSKRSIERRSRQGIKVVSRDLPVNPTYVTQIRQTGVKVWYTSRWLNAVLVEGIASQLTSIRNLAFVSGVEFNRALANARSRPKRNLSAMSGGV